MNVLAGPRGEKMTHEELVVRAASTPAELFELQMKYPQAMEQIERQRFTPTNHPEATVIVCKE